MSNPEERETGCPIFSHVCCQNSCWRIRSGSSSSTSMIFDLQPQRKQKSRSGEYHSSSEAPTTLSMSRKQILLHCSHFKSNVIYHFTTFCRLTHSANDDEQHISLSPRTNTQLPHHTSVQMEMCQWWKGANKQTKWKFVELLIAHFEECAHILLGDTAAAEHYANPKAIWKSQLLAQFCFQANSSIRKFSVEQQYWREAGNLRTCW